MPAPVPFHYLPRPALHGPCSIAPLQAGRRVHIELFANRFAVLVPARIGVRGACRAHTWTTEPTGVVRFDRPATLDSLFTVWGRALSATRMLDFRGAVSIYRNGRRVRGDPGAVPLVAGDELVLEVGGYVPPHRFYRFPPH